MTYLIAFLVPAIIWFFSTAFSKIFPFGNNIIFTSDMAYQYAGYFEYIQKILTEGVSAFFSFYKGMGEECLGMISYYMMSPFNLIVALFPENNITEAVLLINLLKIGACGLTFSIFIKNKFKSYKNNSFAVVGFSTCYALMAYNIAYQFNIMWLDGVVWLPIIILGIDRLISENKSALFYISLTVALISNWYIGFMLCVFSLLYVIYSLILHNNASLKKTILKKFILFGILSAGTALIVIFPAALTCLSETDRGEMLNKSSINYVLIDILSKFVIGGFNFQQITDKSIYEEYLNLPNLFAGTSILLLFVLYFFNNSIDKRQKKIDGIFCIVLISMTLFGMLNRVWHAFTCNVWFPYRYSFCLTFFMIYVAYKSFLEIDSMEQKKIWKIFFVMTAAYFIIEKLNYTYIMTELIYTTVLMLFAFCIAFKLIKAKEKSAYLAFMIMILLECFMNTIVYMQNFEYKDRNKFYADRDKVACNLEKISGKDKSYRIENGLIEDYNASLSLEYPGITSSSTMGKESSRGLAEALGYTRVVFNSIEYSKTTRFADNFLGIKYYITDEIETNEDALSIGFSVNDSITEIKDFLTRWGEHSNSFEKQNELIKKATGIEDTLYKPMKIFDISTENLEETEGNNYKKVYSGMKSLYSFKFTAENENEIYLKINGGTLSRSKLYVNGKELCEYMVADNYSAISLGKFRKNETVEIDLEVISPNNIEIYDVMLYYEDIDVYKEVMEELKKDMLNIENMTSSSLEGKINISKENQLLLFSIPYDKYLTVYIDGAPADSICVLDSLIAVPVSLGEHSVKVLYEPNYLVAVTAISSAFLILAGIIIILENKKGKNKKQ